MKPVRRRAHLVGTIGILSLLLSGCGRHYVLLNPRGPVGDSEYHLLVLASVTMGIVIVAVLALFFWTVIRFRDKPGNRAPYMPNWHGHRWLEPIWFLVPAVLLTVIAIPTVKITYALAKVPVHSHPLVVDVTSLDWKWLFEYPSQHLATVNYAVIPTGRPVLFELTANSPMNTFWVPQLGGMEFAMPGRILPLWLTADKAGTYWGHGANFTGREFAKMFFQVRAVSPRQFAGWVHQAGKNPAMTMSDYHRLLQMNTANRQTYGGFPAASFPSVSKGFSLNGGMYVLPHNDPRKN